VGAILLKSFVPKDVEVGSGAGAVAGVASGVGAGAGPPRVVVVVDGPAAASGVHSDSVKIASQMGAALARALASGTHSGQPRLVYKLFRCSSHLALAPVAA
jgi:hypothetical protein